MSNNCLKFKEELSYLTRDCDMLIMFFVFFVQVENDAVVALALRKGYPLISLSLYNNCRRCCCFAFYGASNGVMNCISFFSWCR